MNGINVEQLRADMIGEAARMLAHAFVTNPLHVAAFGPHHLARNEAFFREGLRRMKGTKLAATDKGRVVGVVHWVRSPSCQFSAIEKLAMAPAMLRSFGPRSSARLVQWLSVWSKHDPGEAHVHLGPIGVSPESQGRRIGQKLMKLYCEELDQGREAGYLETDRPKNVKFYESFGFKVTAEIRVLDVRNFLMRREAFR